MIIGNVVGNVWATRKDSSLNGLKLMVVKRLDGCSEKDSFVAADLVGAGIGEKVLVVSGSSARVASGLANSLVDAVIIGIIDQVEIQEDN